MSNALWSSGIFVKVAAQVSTVWTSNAFMAESVAEPTVWREWGVFVGGKFFGEVFGLVNIRYIPYLG